MVHARSILSNQGKRMIYREQRSSVRPVDESGLEGMNRGKEKRAGCPALALIIGA